MMTTWKIGQPASIIVGQLVKFDYNGSVWQGQIVSDGLKVRVTDTPVKRMVGQIVTIKAGQVVAWQRAR